MDVKYLWYMLQQSSEGNRINLDREIEAAMKKRWLTMGGGDMERRANWHVLPHGHMQPTSHQTVWVLILGQLVVTAWDVVVVWRLLTVVCAVVFMVSSCASAGASGTGWSKSFGMALVDHNFLCRLAIGSVEQCFRYLTM
jgi:hypothetical protein